MGRKRAGLELQAQPKLEALLLTTSNQDLDA